MAGVIFGDSGVYSALVSTPMSNELSNYIACSNEQAMGSLTDFGRQFYSRTRDVRQRTGYDRFISLREQLDKSISMLHDEDGIRQLIDLSDFEYAKPRMRRWMRAEPTIRSQIRNKILANWDELLEDDDPDIRPEDRAEYQYIMQGILHDKDILDDDGNIIDTQGLITEYGSHEVDMLEETERLSSLDKLDILTSWEKAKAIIHHEKKDPTSPWGATLD